LLLSGENALWKDGGLHNMLHPSADGANPRQAAKVIELRIAPKGFPPCDVAGQG